MQNQVEQVNYDVVIIGGGTAGVAAAYALKNSGKKILLVEEQERLGGTAVLAYVFDWIAGVFPAYLSEVFSFLMGKKKAGGELNESWLPKYFYEEACKAKCKNNLNNSIRMAPLDLSEKYYADLHGSIDIWLNHQFVSIKEMSNGVISKIGVLDIKGNTEKCIGAAYFIDSSADADLCRSGGAVEGKDFFVGRDAQSLYNESIAEKNPDRTQLNEPGLFYELADYANDTELFESVKNVELKCFGETEKKVCKPDYINDDGYILGSIMNEKGPGYWCNTMMAIGLTGYAVITDGIESVFREAQKRILEHWKYVKLSLELVYRQRHDDNEEWGISWNVGQRTLSYNDHAPMLGIRESYRVACEYMLNQNDLAKKYTEATDAIAIGTHAVDMHNKTGIKEAELTRFNQEDLRPYGIPYRCLLPKRFSNALIACRAFGASQIAASSARTNKLVSQLGWAAGNAVKFSMDTGRKLKDISGGELQAKGYIDFQYYADHITGIIKTF